MILRNLALLVISGTVLLGCLESEESCFERLTGDFQSTIEFADSDDCSKGSGEQDCVTYALTSLRSKQAIYLLYQDNDQNACDFISDGAQLRRK